MFNMTKKDVVKALGTISVFGSILAADIYTLTRLSNACDKGDMSKLGFALSDVFVSGGAIALTCTVGEPVATALDDAIDDLFDDDMKLQYEFSKKS